MKPAIIIVTYNRPHSLKRLLDSIEKGVYNLSDIPLVISIDYQDSENHRQVVDIANNFEWKHGEKRIIEHTSNMGLRNHVLSCGNLSNEYESIIVLEDDLYVSPQFYDFSVQTLDFYKESDSVAGISLYKHTRNVRPFYPQKNDKDVYFMQFAMSWGQCWTKKMWNDFYQWYEKNMDFPTIIDADIPAIVSHWPQSSWLKYFIKYVIKKNKYFVYPYESLSTNFSDNGTHVHNQDFNNDAQIPLQLYSKTYNLSTIKDAVLYDAFFERIGLEKFLQVDDVCVDLYGLKNNKQGSRYLLTMNRLQYKVLKSFGLNFRPHELNVILNNIGADIFLYDTKYKSLDKVGKTNYISVFEYDNPTIYIKDLMKFFICKILRKVKK